MDGQRTVLVDELIGPALRLLGGARLHGAAFEIDGGALRAQVEADGVEVEPLFEDRGQQVLTAMLLHVIEAAIPIDGALDRLGRQGRGQEVGDAIVLVHHIDHRDSADGAGIEGLPARTGVEGGAVEVDGLGVRGAVDHARGEIAQVGIGVVEAFGHGKIPFWQTGRGVA